LFLHISVSSVSFQTEAARNRRGLCQLVTLEYLLEFRSVAVGSFIAEAIGTCATGPRDAESESVIVAYRIAGNFHNTNNGATASTATVAAFAPFAAIPPFASRTAIGVAGATRGAVATILTHSPFTGVSTIAAIAGGDRIVGDGRFSPATEDNANGSSASSAEITTGPVQSASTASAATGRAGESSTTTAATAAAPAISA
jgi:phage terminase large subunit-like protein